MGLECIIFKNILLRIGKMEIGRYFENWCLDSPFWMGQTMTVFNISEKIPWVKHSLNVNAMWNFNLDTPILINFGEMS